MAGRAKTKQILADKIAETAGIAKVQQSTGSTIPTEFYRSLAAALGVVLEEGMSGPAIAQKVVRGAGLEWPKDADSSATPSGGGGTITAIGLKVLLAATEAIRMRAVGATANPTSDEVGKLSGAAGETDEEEADVRPGVHSLKIYENFRNDWWYALSELVDNSIASYERLRTLVGADGNSLPKLNISIELSDAQVIVRDNAGGIDASTIRRDLQVGTRPEDHSQLNKYVIAMKTSVFWMGKKIAIKTTERNSGTERHLELDLSEITSDSETVPIRRGLAVYEEHGTTITISKLYRNAPRTSTLTKTRNYLASIYRKYLETEQVQITLNGSSLAFQPLQIVEAPFYDSDKEPTEQPVRHWKEDFEVVIPAELDTTNHPRDRRVSGWVGIFEWGARKEGKREHAGITGFWRNRVVLGQSVGGQTFIDGNNGTWKPRELQLNTSRPPSLRLTGEVYLDDFTVGTHKNSIDWNEEQQTFLWRAVLQQLKAGPFWDMVHNYAPSGPRKRGTKTVAGAPTVPESPLPPIPKPELVPLSGPTEADSSPPNGRRETAMRIAHEINWSGGVKTQIQLANVKMESPYLLTFERVPNGSEEEFHVRLNERSRYVQEFRPTPEALEEIETVAAAFAHAQLYFRMQDDSRASLAHDFHLYFEYALEQICKSHQMRGQSR